MDETRGILYSFIAHLVIVLAMVVQIVFYPSDALDLSTAIRVDMIDLPDKIISQSLPEEVPEKEEKLKPKSKLLPDKKEKPKEDSININKVKSKQKEASE